MTESNDIGDNIDEAIRGVEKIQKEKTSVKRRRFYAEFAKNQDITKWKRPVYVIHEHYSSRLHWDLRFEDGGKMETWQLFKNPSQLPRKAQKRDPIPIGAAFFAGEIKQEYGAGKMKIWDRGTFDLVESNENQFVVDIRGEKLKGKYRIRHHEPSNIPRLDYWLFEKMK